MQRVLPAVTSVRARPEKKENIVKTLNHHLPVIARAIVKMTRTGGIVIENVMTEKDTRGLAFSGRHHLTTSIDMSQEVASTAARAIRKTRQRRTRRDRNTASAIVTIIGIEATDLTKGYVTEIEIEIATGMAKGTWREAGVPVGGIETSETVIASVSVTAIEANGVTEVMIEIGTDDELQFQLIATFLEDSMSGRAQEYG
jgi:hypothetical protein